MVGATLPGFLAGSLAPRIDDDFAFGGFELGAAVAAFNVVSCIASIPAGRLVDRIGARAGLRLSALAVVVACAIAIVSGSAVVLITGLAIGGLGNALCGPAAIAMLRRAVERTRHGLAFGAMQAGAPVGSLAAGLALPVVALPLGWRWAFAATAVVSVAAAELGASRPAAADADAPVPAPRAVGPHAAGVPPADVAGVWAIAGAAVLASAAAIGTVSFLVVYAVEEGMAETAAGLTLAAVSLAAAASRLAIGVVSDRSARDPLAPMAVLIAASVAGYVLIALGGAAGVVAGAVIVGLVGWAWAGAFNQAAVESAPGAPAWATGVMMTGLLAGAVIGPLVVGVLADAGAFTAAWATCGALAVAAGAVTWWVARRRARGSTRTAAG